MLRLAMAIVYSSDDTVAFHGAPPSMPNGFDCPLEQPDSAAADLRALGGVSSCVVRAVGGVSSCVVRAVGGISSCVVRAVGGVSSCVVRAMGGVSSCVVRAVGGVSSCVVRAMGGVSSLIGTWFTMISEHVGELLFAAESGNLRAVRHLVENRHAAVDGESAVGTVVRSR